MNNHDFKMKLIDALMSRDVFTDMPSRIELRTRCPYCGDSQKNLRTGHLYIRINIDDNMPVVYNCFKCPAHGILKYEDLELLGLEGSDFQNGISSLNKTSDKITTGMDSNTKDKYFEYKIPTIINRKKLEYIENRLQIPFKDEDIQDMKIITSLKSFLRTNQIDRLTCKKSFANLLENNYVGFLSSNNAYILFRDITDFSEIRWVKYPISEESKGQRIFYSIKSSVDLYSKDEITINISEGVMDCLSIYHNFMKDKENTLNLAICGKFYINTIRYLISTGFIGKNIHINIFADNDKTEDTSVEYFKRNIEKYAPFIGKVDLYYNTIYKDCGVPLDQIRLQKYKIV